MENSEPDPDLEIYKAVRAHEVMLNQAASAFEHAVYTRLAALNGGAAAAFVTLLGTLLKSDGKEAVQPVNRPLAATAVGLWLLGLFVASIAAMHGYRRQRETNIDFRYKREEVEKVIGKGQLERPGYWPGPGSLTVADIVRGGEGGIDASLRWFVRSLWLSAGLFVAGAIPALLAVLLVGA
jgi:hypothetical protein